MSQTQPHPDLVERMEKGINFSRLRTGRVFKFHHQLYRKVKPVAVGYTRAFQTKYHNCEDLATGKTRFLYATITVIPVEFEDVRAEGNGKLLFRYCRECDLIEIKPKGEERPLLVKLN